MFCVENMFFVNFLAYDVTFQNNEWAESKVDENLPNMFSIKIKSKENFF